MLADGTSGWNLELWARLEVLEGSSESVAHVLLPMLSIRDAGHRKPASSVTHGRS